jgi:tetratricopeptide (TPR) repeat protein
MNKYGKLRFVKSKNDGRFDFGNKRQLLFERFYDACEMEDEEAAGLELLKIIEEDNEFIEAYNRLGWEAMGSDNFGLARVFYFGAYDICDELIPKNFKGEISWTNIDNRPFLRALYGLGLTFLYVNDFITALQYFNKILEYNRNDNQGARASVIHCYMALGDFKGILKVCNSYSEDGLLEVLYGRAFALFYLDRLDESKKALNDAISLYPLIAKELVSAKYKPFPDRNPEVQVCGSKEEAEYYLSEFGHYWINPKLKEFLKNGLK